MTQHELEILLGEADLARLNGKEMVLRAETVQSLVRDYMDLHLVCDDSVVYDDECDECAKKRTEIKDLENALEDSERELAARERELERLSLKFDEQSIAFDRVLKLPCAECGGVIGNDK